MYELKRPKREYLNTATQTAPAPPTSRQVDLAMTSFEEIESKLQPVLKELGLFAESEWTPDGIRLTFAHRQDAMKFRLRFKEC